jgi:competence protein ComFC
MVETGRWVFSSSSGRFSQLFPVGLPNLGRELASSFARLLFPDDCRLCGQPLEDSSRIPVCGACLRLPVPLASEYFCATCRTPFANPFPLDASGRCALCRNNLQGFDAAYSFGAYQGALRDLIHLLKYERIRTLGRPLGNFLAAAFPRDQRFDAIVPMPLHWRRQWQRGFNQSALLAGEVGRRFGLPVIEAVRRARATASQAGLTNAKRRANVTGAFAPARRIPVTGLRLLLVDDVLTTGATASACSRALKSAGACYVAFLALARADRRFGPGAPDREPPGTGLGAGL